jgi:hypothetical protein
VSGATEASSVNKPCCWQLKFPFLLDVLLAGRGGEGEDIGGALDSLAAGETHAASSSSYPTVTTGGSSISDAQRWHQSTRGRSRSNLLRRHDLDDAMVTLHIFFLPSGSVPDEADGGCRRSSSSSCDVREGPDCVSAITLEGKKPRTGL